MLCAGARPAQGSARHVDLQGRLPFEHGASGGLRMVAASGRPGPSVCFQQRFVGFFDISSAIHQRKFGAHYTLWMFVCGVVWCAKFHQRKYRGLCAIVNSSSWHKQN